MRDPKTVTDAIVMEQIVIAGDDLYDVAARYINRNILIILKAGAPENIPLVFAVSDCDDEEKELLAYKLAEGLGERCGHRIRPRKIESNCYILEKVSL